MWVKRFSVMGYGFVLFGILFQNASASQQFQSPSKTSDVTGILAIQQQQNCFGGAANCPQQYKLYQQNMHHWVDLTGPVDQGLEHYLVRVSGRWADAQHSRLRVTTITTLSTMPYHQFLVDAADRYTLSHYPCRLLWDKSFGWAYQQGRAQLVVRLTRFPDQWNSPRLLLRFDARSQHLLAAQEVNWLAPQCTKRRN